MSCDKPILPFPAPLRGAEKGTFTNRSIVQRLPEIGRRTLEENNFSPETTTNIRQLLKEIPNGPIRFLKDDAGDADSWNSTIRPHRDKNWLDPPWFFVENYFYRRMLEATGYFSAGPGRGVDPFTNQKSRALKRAATDDLCGEASIYFNQDGWHGDALSWFISTSLWGNRADLSMWPAGLKGSDEKDPIRPERALVDDTQTVCSFLQNLGKRTRIDFLIDNAGIELVADLLFVVYILQKKIARRVGLHVKEHPTFVSDTTAQDLTIVVKFLVDAAYPEAKQAGERIVGFLESGRLSIEHHPIWTSPLPLWEMPLKLREHLGQADLIISKGDAHYRRLLGDRHWPLFTPIDHILCYLPSPLLALRTLKSEVAAGIEPDQIEHAKQIDPDWLISGQWGIIQFWDGKAKDNIINQ